jgi:hypothetical protein
LGGCPTFSFPLAARKRKNEQRDKELKERIKNKKIEMAAWA